MPITTQSVKDLFPEFDAYTAPQIQPWIDIAPLYLNPLVWTDQDTLDFATKLFVAHNLVLSARDALAAAVGGISGTAQGIETSKTVDKVSVSRDAGSVSMEDGGQWNMTSYGIRLLQLARIWGAGGLQIMPAGQYSLGQVPLFYSGSN